MVSVTKQCVCMVLIPFVLFTICYTMLNYHQMKNLLVFNRSVINSLLCPPISSEESNQQDSLAVDAKSLPYTTKKVKNLKNIKVKVKNLIPRQVIDYFYWKNASSCNLKKTVGTGLKMINPIGFVRNPSA